MKIGRSKVNITPKEEIYLAGYSHRSGKAKNINSDLFIKTYILNSNNTKVLLIVADLIWWDDEFVSQLKKEIYKLYDIEKLNIIFHATHNHSGPQTSFKFSSQLGKADKNYMRFLYRKVFEAVEIALEELTEVQVAIYRGNSFVGINRRLKKGNQITMAPNKNGEMDERLTTIVFRNETNQVIAMWLNYGCHPTTSDENRISSEFTGICTGLLEREFPNAIVAYLQAFCGDVRPNLVEKNSFYRGDFESTRCFGNKLFEDVLRSLNNHEENALEENLYLKSTSLNLTFSNKDVSHIIPDNQRKEWRGLLAVNKEKYTLNFNMLSLFSNLKFLTCNGEVVSHYSNFIKELDKSVLTMGYTNGMIGYIPTKQQLIQGGYEAEESIIYFGYPNILDEKIEMEIKRKLRKVLTKENFNG